MGTRLFFISHTAAYLQNGCRSSSLTETQIERARVERNPGSFCTLVNRLGPPSPLLLPSEDLVVTPLICEAWRVSVEVQDEYHECQTALSYSRLRHTARGAKRHAQRPPALPLQRLWGLLR